MQDKIPVMEATLLQGTVLLAAIVSCTAVNFMRSELLEKEYYGQPPSLSTSSTLAWVSSTDGPQPPVGAVPVSEEGGDVWCRSEIKGQWAAGAVKDGECVYPFLSSVYRSKDYHTLVSMNGSAYYKYTEWDKFEAYPKMAVSTSTMLLAVFKDEESGLTMPGFVEQMTRELYFLKDYKEVFRNQSAMIVYEVQPKEYELFTIELSDKNKEVEFEDVVVAQIYLENPSPRSKEVSSEEDYQVTHEQYWGNIVQGTIRGHPFSVPPAMLPPAETLTWGTNNAVTLSDTQEVSYFLPPESAVSGRLIAKMRTLDTTYFASLTALYGDNSQISRPITARYKDIRLAELRVEFDQPHRISDKTPIEELDAKTSILRHSTTTTTTTTTTPAPGQRAHSSTQDLASSGPRMAFNIPISFVLVVFGYGRRN